MTFEQEKKKQKPLLPIRFTALYGKRPPLEEPTAGKTPEPAKVEAPKTPTPTPESLGRTFGRPSTPMSRTKGIEEFNKQRAT